MLKMEMKLRMDIDLPGNNQWPALKDTLGGKHMSEIYCHYS